MVYSGVATGLFSIRNANRTSNGEVGRLPVAVGQIASTLKEVSKQSNIFARGIRGTLETIEEVAKYDKMCNSIYDGISKTVKFASKNVNPLIVCSSGLNVLNADDKKSALISESGTLAGMFATEGMMKKYLDKVVDTLPIGKKWKPVIKGLMFFAGSIAGSTIGHDMGKKVAEKVKDAENNKSTITTQTIQHPLKQQLSNTQLSYVS